ncbi:MAG: glycogen/starch synthase, partial [Planctomycetota bacterium]
MLKALMATSEVTPLAKTGGLADVCGALPGALRQLGHEVTLIMPAYRCALRSCLAQPTGISCEIPVGGKLVPAEYLTATLPNSDVPVILVKQDQYFDRDGLYGDGQVDFRDNCERFVFFSRAVLEAIRVLDLDIQLIHCNDWQTGLIPAYLEIEYRAARAYERIASLFTIHNLAYQGQFWHWDMLLTGLDWKYFNWRQLEFFGDLNLLKAGVVFADEVSTVSPRYAEEIQTPQHGFGLDGLLQQQKNKLSGILNGVDYTTWNPSIDDYLPQKFGLQNWPAGKAAARQKLQADLGMRMDSSAPLIGVIGRVTEQKGSDLVAQLIERWAPTQAAQWVILGSGDKQIEQRLSQVAREYPHR